MDAMASVYAKTPLACRDIAGRDFGGSKRGFGWCIFHSSRGTNVMSEHVNLDPYSEGA